MKKILIVLSLCLIGILATANLLNNSSAEATDNESLVELLSDYYNNGSYKKRTEIYLTESAASELKKYFHAGSTILERTTYYNGNELWMSRGKEVDGVTYSYYGTAYDGEKEIGVTNAATTEKLVTPANAPIALTGDGKESMENYYVTLKDISEANYENIEWTYTNGVYSTTDPNVITNFRLFTAPCFLEITAENINYLQFSKVTVEELYGTLELKLYVAVTEEKGKLTTTNGLFSQATIAKNVDDVFGTESDPYQINSQEDFDNFKSKALSGVTFSGKYIELNADVTLNDVMYKTSASQFAGTLDGKDHKITVNLSGTDHVAVFGYIDKMSVIKNVNVYGNVSATAAKAGGLVATCYGKVYDCANYATVTSTSDEVGGLLGYLCIDGEIYDSQNYGAVNGANRVGGISGYAGGGSVLDGCCNEGTITGTKSIGGILGIASKAGKVTNNTNKGPVHGNVPKFNSNTGVGGIIGSAVEGDSKLCTISGNINEGKVENKGVCTGGIVGILRGTWNVQNCENKGEIIAEGSLAGGILGVTDVDGNKIDGCTNNGSVTAATFVGGIVGGLGIGADRKSLSVSNCTNNGDITATSSTPLVDTSLKSGARVGGIAGMAYGSIVENCTNTGTITSPSGTATANYQTASPYMGLLVGYKTSAATVK